MAVQESTRSRITVQTNSDEGPQTASILPCHVGYTGNAPVDTYYKPTALPGDLQEAYFRGRRLIGTTSELPVGYMGFVFDTSAPAQTQAITDETQSLEDSYCDAALNATTELEELKVWRQRAKFDKLVVYGNAIAVDAQRDAYLRGTQEWIDLARAIHG